jgi:protocatechuate 3,4-dioxygenase beta subunit
LSNLFKSTRTTLKVALLILLSTCSLCSAQTAAAPSSASVSGRVTIGGKGLAGLPVAALQGSSRFDNKMVARTITDDEGKYRLTGLPAGHFLITPIAKAYVVVAGDTFKPPGETINVAVNESINNIDFALTRGGVITGRITDLEGHPIIGEAVNLKAQGNSADIRRFSYSRSRKEETDDRGIYRIYGLGPGSYKVSVGQDLNATRYGSPYDSQYARAFYPGVADESKATAIEINEGSEANNIDITAGKVAGGFSVSGRVIDAESGKPVANTDLAYVALNLSNQQRGDTNYAGVQSDADGRFRMEGMQPGRYEVFVFAGENSNYSEKAPVDISDTDITGVEIKVRRGATIEGVAVIENNTDPATAALLQRVFLIASSGYENSTIAGSYSRGSINADGSFRFTGLAPGKAEINIMVFGNTMPKGLHLLRTELQGVEQTEGIELTAGAHITGVRLVFTYGTGKITGEVKVEAGALPQNSAFVLLLRPVGNSSYSIEVDARGHFLADNLAPGSYELTLKPRQNTPAFEPVTRTVTVANGTDTQVTLVLDLAGKKAGP